MNIKPLLVVFDIDGTLTRSVSVHQAALFEALEAFGLADIPTDWGGYRHFTDSWIFQENMLRQFDRVPSEEEFTRFETLFATAYFERIGEKQVDPMPGSAACLAELAAQGVPYCFATGSLRPAAEHKLASFQEVPTLPVLATASEGLTREDIIANAVQLAASQHGVDRFERVVSVGDGVWDWHTARGLGFEFLAVAEGAQRSTLADLGAQHFIADFQDDAWRQHLLLSAEEIKSLLLEAVEPLLRPEERIVILHSALSRLGFARGGAYLRGLIGFLEELVQRGLTVVLPSFTFSYPKRQFFHLDDPSETGCLADLAREYAQFVRTQNPMFSFVVKGPLMDEFMHTRFDSGYGTGTAVARLDAEDVVVVKLGAPWSTCTVIHVVEEKLQVPYRKYVEWNYPTDYGSGPETRSFTAFVRDSELSSALRFDRMQGDLLAEGVMRRSILNGLVIEAANAREITSIASRNILQDPYYYVDKR